MAGFVASDFRTQALALLASARASLQVMARRAEKFFVPAPSHNAARQSVAPNLNRNALAGAQCCWKLTFASCVQRVAKSRARRAQSVLSAATA
jgi:hypothetical protein